MRCCGCESTNIQPCPSATPRAISTARRPARTPCPRTCGGSCASSGCCETVTRDLFLAVFLVVRKPGGARLMSACPPTAAQKRTFNHFGLGRNAEVAWIQLSLSPTRQISQSHHTPALVGQSLEALRMVRPVEELVALGQ